jgi:hypothetical protein
VKYSWRVKMHRYSRSGEWVDTTEYKTVIARDLKRACVAALRNAIKDSGFKTGWVVVAAERGEWVVV